MEKISNKDPISQALDVKPMEGEIVPSKQEKTVDENLENDFKYARENLYNIIERGTDALNGIVDLAQQSQHPRSFEVVADLVRTLSTANKDLLDKQVIIPSPANKQILYTFNKATEIIVVHEWRHIDHIRELLKK